MTRMDTHADGFQWIDHIRESSREEWSRLADQYDTPLLDWDWLRVLEDSGSVAPDYGWIPQHLLLRRNGRLVAAAPLYVKTQSAGEFVFGSLSLTMRGRTSPVNLILPTTRSS